MPLAHKYALTAIAIAFGGAALLGVGTASADTPMDNPLINSTCSFAQVDKALHAEAPDVAAKLDAHPDKKAMLQKVYDQPVDQRKAAISAFVSAHPDKVAQMQQRATANPDKVAKFKALTGQLAQTCHSY